jgi:hypothetical protein
MSNVKNTNVDKKYLKNKRIRDEIELDSNDLYSVEDNLMEKLDRDIGVYIYSEY